uniref:Transglutaminase N-terminal domain-containing protein n=1 Tax=Oryzias sinensis TaxID=183150 RepID=A0A8C7XUF9_9TELE
MSDIRSSNNSSHHTELFGDERLIVRRGQPFSITLHLSSVLHTFVFCVETF